mgnify:CR=1 FL=1
MAYAKTYRILIKLNRVFLRLQTRGSNLSMFIYIEGMHVFVSNIGFHKKCFKKYPTWLGWDRSGPQALVTSITLHGARIYIRHRDRFLRN